MTRARYLAIGALAAVIVVAAVAWRIRAHEAPDRSAASLAQQREPLALADSDLEPRAIVEESSPDSLSAAPRSGIEVHGRVVTLDGEPVPEVLVMLGRFGSAAPVATTDADGAFRGFGSMSSGRLTIESERWVAVNPEGFAWAAGNAVEIVAAPRGRISGRVVDARGDPVAGASVALRAAPQIHARFEQRLGDSLDVIHLTFSDAEGRFGIADAAALPNSRLIAACPPLEPRTEILPLGVGEGVIVQLSDPESGRVLQGLVQSEQLEPVEGAVASVGHRKSRPTRADGRFRIHVTGLDRDPVEPGAPLVVEEVRDGGVFVLPEFGATLADRSAPLPFVVATLGAGHELEVCVRMRDGASAKQIQVEILDKTPLGPSPSVGFVERDSSEYISFGCSRLSGLLPREYHLRVHVLDLPWSVDYGPVRPERGSITIEADVDLVPVTFRVLTSDGAPVQGAFVGLGTRAGRAIREGDDLGFLRRGGSVQRTAADGRATIPDVPTSGVVATVHGPGILPQAVDVPLLAGAEDVEIGVARAARLVIDFGEPGKSPAWRETPLAESVEVEVQLLDGSGAAQSLYESAGDQIAWSSDSSPTLCVRGLWRTFTFFAAEGPCTLRVFSRESATANTPEREVELLRRELVLSSRETTVVDR